MTPVGYAHMTAELMKLAHGRVALVLEGGYSTCGAAAAAVDPYADTPARFDGSRALADLNSVAKSVAACVRTLLGDAPPPLPDKAPRKGALEAIEITRSSLEPYWPCLSKKKAGGAR